MTLTKSKSATLKFTASLGFEAELWLTASSEGEKTLRSVRLLGRVYENLLTRFASAEGNNGGQLYTPNRVEQCQIKMRAHHRPGHWQIVLAVPSIESGEWRTFHRVAK